MTGAILAKQTLELFNALFFNNACVVVALKSYRANRIKYVKKIALLAAVLLPEMEKRLVKLGTSNVIARSGNTNKLQRV